MAHYRYLGLDIVHVPALGLEFLKPGAEFETDEPVNNPIFEPLDLSESASPEPKTPEPEE